MKLKNFETKEKFNIGENSIFYRMKDQEDQTAILKLTKIHNQNVFAFNGLYEAELLQKMSRYTGFPRLIDSGYVGDYSYSLMTELGVSLESLKSMCEDKFSLKTTLMVLDQMIERVQ